MSEIDALIGRSDPQMPDDARVWVKVAQTKIRQLFVEDEEPERFMSIPRFVADRRSNPVRSMAADLRAHKLNLRVTQEQLDLYAEAAPQQPPVAPAPTSNEVFIVHGHDRTLLLEVERFLTRAGLQPTILADAASQGATIIEKFELHANRSAYAVILLTADDLGRAKADTVDSPRARQNVILELGYFIGKLGRRRVCILHEPGIEPPSDIHGVVYVSVAADWKETLTREMRSAGLTVVR